MREMLGVKRYTITVVYVGLIFLFLLFALMFGAFGMQDQAVGLLWLTGIFTILYPIGYVLLYHT